MDNTFLLHNSLMKKFVASARETASYKDIGSSIVVRFLIQSLKLHPKQIES